MPAQSASYALVLTAAPGKLEPALPRGLVAALPNGSVINERWLGEHEAFEALFVENVEIDLALVRRLLAELAGNAPVDVNVIPDDIAWRRRRLLVADMESTIVEQECLDEIAALTGLGERITDITRRAMRGELDFEAALTERVAMLAGLDDAVLERIYESLTFMPGAATLVATMRAHGATAALVSGGFTYYTERIAARAGFDTQQANTLDVANGRVVGTVRRPILGRAAKRDALQRIAREKGLSPIETLAVGDGANDLDMIAAAGLGVAFRAKPAVREAASALRNGAVVTHGDLTALLYLQGYRRDEFVATR